MHLIAGRYVPVPDDGGAIWNPARDTVSGALVSILRAPAPADALTRFQELDRVRRYAAVRRPHLAEVLTAEVHGGELHVVCRAVGGRLLDPGSPPPDLTVTDLRQIAADLLDALAALQLTGVVQGWFRPGVVLVPAVPARPGGAAVTLLPLPVTGAPSTDAGAVDDRARAATLLLRLLRHVRGTGREDDALADELAGALVRMGASPDESWGPPGSGLFAPSMAGPWVPPVPLALAPGSLVASPLLPVGDGEGASAAAPGPRSRARDGVARVRWWIAAVAAVVVAAAVTAATLLGNR